MHPSQSTHKPDPSSSRPSIESTQSQQSSDSDSQSEVEAEDVDEHKPTFAQFQGESEEEDELDTEGSDEDSEDPEGEEDSDDGQEQQIRTKLASIPFGALLKAKKATPRRATPDDDDGDDDISEEDGWAEDRAWASARSQGNKIASKTRYVREAKGDAVRQALRAPSDQTGRRKSGPSSERDGDSRRTDRQDPQKRTNKHAPTEVSSSSRPVSRKRIVVEPTQREYRDPRFSNLSGPQVNAGLFSANYAFLPSIQSEELTTLKRTHSRLRKLEAHQAGPKARSEQALQIRAEREQVEQALKRAEAQDAERKRREREKEVMSRFKKENDERVAKGGARFYLKDKDKRNLMLKDKFERLAGGRASTSRAELTSSSGPSTSSRPTEPSNSRALRKVLDKRRKKNAAKERKNMPFLIDERGGASGSAIPARKRRRR